MIPGDIRMNRPEPAGAASVLVAWTGHHHRRPALSVADAAAGDARVALGILRTAAFGAIGPATVALPAGTPASRRNDGERSGEW